MPPLEIRITFLFRPAVHKPLRKSARIRIAPGALGFDQRSLTEPGTLEAARIPALSIVSVFLYGGLIYERSRGTGATHLRSAPEALERLINCSLLIAKCIRSRNNFTLFTKIFRKIFRRNTSMLKATGKCNLAGHLLSQRTEGVFGYWRVAPLCSESFKSQQVIIGL
jgi:hypothetical protein